MNRAAGRRAVGLGFALGIAVGIGLALPAGAADAGIYECTGADGRLRYTSDPSQCANARPKSLKKGLQRVIEDDTARRRSPRPATRRPGAGGDGLESMWRSKRPAAERELQEIEARLARMQKVVKSCNRGGEWYRTSESGIREHVPCDVLHDDHAEMERKRAALVHYLAEGLEDECRRAGCQPGWVR